MKKIISLILCFSLCFSLCITAAASANNEISLSVLKALKIGNFSDADKEVTRGEFIGAVSDILNYYDRPGVKDGIFSDVTSSYEYSGAVYDAYARGLISGYQDGTFGAKSPILYEHAVKVLVAALGYDNLAKAQGGYPAGYMLVASQHGILKGVAQKGGDTLNAAVAAKLIENAMNANVFMQVVFGDDKEGYSEKVGETLLKVYAKIEKVSGLVSDNGVTSLTGSSAVKSGSIMIDGKVYAQGESGACDFLGYKTVAYVSCTGDNDEKVYYIEKDKSVTTLLIPANRILHSDPDFSAKNIYYEDIYGSRLYAKVDSVADFIYNGRAYLDLTGADLKIEIGSIELIDNNFDNVYDIVKVNAFESFAVSGVSEASGKIYKKNGAALSVDSSKNVEIYRDGKAAVLTDIQEWDIVNAAVSLDKSTVALNVSSKKINGRVENISKSDRTISVDGDYYHVLNDELMEAVSLSSSYEFCLDCEQNIAWIKSENNSDKYVGIVIDAKIKEGVDRKAQVQIFSSLGNFDVLDLSKNVSIDGNTSLSGDEQISYILSNMKDNLVSCRMDNKGNISEISLPYTSKPGAHQTTESLKVDYADGEKAIYCYGSSIKNFEGKIVPNEETAVFLVPDDRSELDSYSVVNMSYFQHSTSYNILAYSIGIENGFSEYIIKLPIGEEEYSRKHVPVVVSKVSKILNDDGMVVEQILGYSSSGEVKAVTKYDNILTSAEVKKGDIIRYKTDVEERITEVDRIIDGTERKKITKVEEAFGKSPRLMLYDVYYRFDNLAGCTTYDLSKTFSEATVEGSILKQTLPPSIKIYEVNGDRDNEITVSSYNAIRDYKSVGAECSKLFIYSYSGSEIMAVIYN